MTEATPDGTPEDDDWLTTQQAAKKMGITRRYLYELIGSGEIATIRVGVEHRIEPAEIKQYADRNRQRVGA